MNLSRICNQPPTLRGHGITQSPCSRSRECTLFPLIIRTHPKIVLDVFGDQSTGALTDNYSNRWSSMALRWSACRWDSSTQYLTGSIVVHSTPALFLNRCRTQHNNPWKRIYVSPGAQVSIASTHQQQLPQNALILTVTTGEDYSYPRISNTERLLQRRRGSPVTCGESIVCEIEEMASREVRNW